MIKPHKKSVSYEASKINNLCSKKKYQIKNTNVQVCLAVVQPLSPRLPFREFAMFLRFYKHREKYKVITKMKAKKNLKYNLGLYEGKYRRHDKYGLGTVDSIRSLALILLVKSLRALI